MKKGGRLAADKILDMGTVEKKEPGNPLQEIEKQLRVKKKTYLQNGMDSLKPGVVADPRFINQLLDAAVYVHDDVRAKELVNKWKGDVNYLNNKTSVSLACLAVKMESTKCLKFLLEKNATLNLEDLVKLKFSYAVFRVIYLHYIESGSKKNKIRWYASQMLYLAVCVDDYVAAQHLFDKYNGGIDYVNATSKHSLVVAAVQKGSRECLKLLIEKGVDIDEQLLNQAIIAGHSKIFKTLLSYFNKLAQSKPLPVSLKSRLQKIYEDAFGLLSHYDRYCQKENEEEKRENEKKTFVKIYLKYMLKIIENGQGIVEETVISDLFLMAIHHDDVGFARNLNEKKAGVITYKSSEDFGMNVAHIAAGSGSSQCLIWLVSKGVDFKSLDKNGHSPLFVALKQKNYNAVTILIKAYLDSRSDLPKKELYTLFSELFKLCENGPMNVEVSKVVATIVSEYSPEKSMKFIKLFFHYAVIDDALLYFKNVLEACFMTALVVCFMSDNRNVEISLAILRYVLSFNDKISLPKEKHKLAVKYCLLATLRPNIGDVVKIDRVSHQLFIHANEICSLEGDAQAILSEVWRLLQVGKFDEASGLILRMGSCDTVAKNPEENKKLKNTHIELYAELNANYFSGEKWEVLSSPGEIRTVIGAKEDLLAAARCSYASVRSAAEKLNSENNYVVTNFVDLWEVFWELLSNELSTDKLVHIIFIMTCYFYESNKRFEEISESNKLIETKLNSAITLGELEELFNLANILSPSDDCFICWCKAQVDVDPNQETKALGPATYQEMLVNLLVYVYTLIQEMCNPRLAITASMDDSPRLSSDGAQKRIKAVLESDQAATIKMKYLQSLISCMQPFRNLLKCKEVHTVLKLCSVLMNRINDGSKYVVTTSCEPDSSPTTILFKIYIFLIKNEQRPDESTMLYRLLAWSEQYCLPPTDELAAQARDICKKKPIKCPSLDNEPMSIFYQSLESFCSMGGWGHLQDEGRIAAARDFNAERDKQELELRSLFKIMVSRHQSVQVLTPLVEEVERRFDDDRWQVYVYTAFELFLQKTSWLLEARTSKRIEGIITLLDGEDLKGFHHRNQEFLFTVVLLLQLFERLVNKMPDDFFQKKKAPDVACDLLDRQFLDVDCLVGMYNKAFPAKGPTLLSRAVQAVNKNLERFRLTVSEQTLPDKHSVRNVLENRWSLANKLRKQALEGLLSCQGQADLCIKQKKIKRRRDEERQDLCHIALSLIETSIETNDPDSVRKVQLGVILALFSPGRLSSDNINKILHLLMSCYCEKSNYEIEVGSKELELWRNIETLACFSQILQEPSKLEKRIINPHELEILDKAKNNPIVFTILLWALLKGCFLNKLGFKIVSEVFTASRSWSSVKLFRDSAYKDVGHELGCISVESCDELIKVCGSAVRS